MHERCYTRRALARRWHTSEARVKALIDDGTLPAFTIHRTILIAPEDVRAYERSQQIDTRPKPVALPLRDHFKGVG